MGNTWSGVKQAKVAQRDKIFTEQKDQVNKVVAELNLSPEKIKEIVSCNVHEVVEKLNSGSLTSLELIAALASRTSTIGKELNLFTQTNFSEAIQAARECDVNRKKTGLKNWTLNDGEYSNDKYLPPLFGIPISIKDTFNMEGFSSTVGLLSRANLKFQDAPMIKALKKSGAILFVRSNVPQFAMAFQSVNNLWGRSLNPWNIKRAVGGSSGGEGGLIAARCSILGVGSDIGGSIRIPAEFCGVYGLKPYSKRISSTNHASYSAAFTGSAVGIPLCIGPLGRCASDLGLFFKVVTNPENYISEMNPYVKNIPFNECAYKKVAEGKQKYKVGYFKNFTDVQATRASQRAVAEVVQILRGEGHELIQIQIPNERQAIRSFLVEAMSSSAQTYRNILKGQKPIKEYKLAFQTAEMWRPTRSIASFGLKRLMPRLHYYFFEKGGRMSAFDYQQHLGTIEQHKGQWIKYWFEKELDFVIAPGFGCQAIIHGKSERTALAASYTFIWNVLDMSVGSMPITVVGENEQQYITRFDDFTATDLKQSAWHSAGMPVGIQVVGLPFEQEKVLGFMAYLEAKIKFSEKHPLPDFDS